MSTRRTTSIDVARRAGVSQSTVSRTFSGASVSAEKRARVLEAARELGYSPNAIARSLSKQRTDIIGVVMSSMASPFNPYVLEILTRRLQENGQQVLFFSVPDDSEVDTVLPRLLDYQVDALILTSTTLSGEMVDRCIETGTPVLLFNRTLPDAAATSVGSDNYAGGRTVAHALVAAGHERIAYVAGPRDTSTNLEREQGFVDGLQETERSLWRRVESTYTYRAGVEAAQDLLSADVRPDAIFCASDVIALGVMDRARQMGLSIPEDLSIIGYDDIPEASWEAYNLTTVRQPVNRMIDAALGLLESQLSEEPAEPTRILMPGTLIARDSARLPDPLPIEVEHA